MKNSEVGGKNTEIRASETNGALSKLDELLQQVKEAGAETGDYDERLQSRLEGQKSVAEPVAFTGIPAEANRYIHESGKHLELSRKYEREANELEKKIREGKQPQSKMSEVRALRSKAAEEKRAAEKCKRKAQEILSQATRRF